MILLRWLLNTLILILVAKIVPGVEFSTFWSALITSVVLGFLNALLKPFLVLLTLPINFLTLGLFTFVINAFLFWLTGTIVAGFKVESFGAALLASVIYSLITTVINYLDQAKNKPRVKILK